MWFLARGQNKSSGPKHFISLFYIEFHQPKSDNTDYQFAALGGLNNWICIDCGKLRPELIVVAHIKIEIKLILVLYVQCIYYKYLISIKRDKLLKRNLL